MNSEEILTNYLSLLKSNVEVYVHGTIEASNKDNKDNLKYGLDQTLLSQERTYNEMVNNSWYEICNVDCSKICDTFKKVSSKF
ncbi:MAG: spore coat protein [Bacilli bacterium]|nr:spore coat protein [Bacilli bacterium]